MSRIREAAYDDIDSLVALRVSFLRETNNVRSDADATAVGDAIRHYLIDAIAERHLVAFVIEEEGRIVGTGWLVFWRRPPLVGDYDGVETYLVNMYTIPERRRRGVATELLQSIIRFAQTTKARCIRLNAIGEIASLYRKAGFKFGDADMRYTW